MCTHWWEMTPKLHAHGTSFINIVNINGKQLQTHTHDIVSMKKLSPAIKDYSNM